jgi:hypothetical protein
LRVPLLLAQRMLLMRIESLGSGIYPKSDPRVGFSLPKTWHDGVSGSFSLLLLTDGAAVARKAAVVCSWLAGFGGWGFFLFRVRECAVETGIGERGFSGLYAFGTDPEGSRACDRWSFTARHRSIDRQVALTSCPPQSSPDSFFLRVGPHQLVTLRARHRGVMTLREGIGGN